LTVLERDIDVFLKRHIWEVDLFAKSVRSRERQERRRRRLLR
jgi:hypothetical protein